MMIRRQLCLEVVVLLDLYMRFFCRSSDREIKSISLNKLCTYLAFIRQWASIDPSKCGMSIVCVHHSFSRVFGRGRTGLNLAKGTIREKNERTLANIVFAYFLLKIVG